MGTTEPGEAAELVRSFHTSFIIEGVSGVSYQALV